jgi:predicted metal-binding membrane protein
VHSRQAFLGVSAIVFAASAASTIVWCGSMAAMGEMPMPGGWTMSHMWMRMPGQSWLGATASFIGMWVVMMVAMMLPSLTPALWRYHRSIAMSRETHRRWLTPTVAAGYFATWAVLGILVFPLGMALADLAMRKPHLARVVPIAVGATVVFAGLLQCTGWKARQLALCRGADRHGRTLEARFGAALRHGWCLGVHCVQSCAGMTAVALVLGMMDLRVMAVVATVVAVERLAQDGARAARAVGTVAAATGLFLIGSAVVPG